VVTYVGERLEVELEVDEAVAVLQLQPTQHIHPNKNTI
jgi:hypothetical protein